LKVGGFALVWLDLDVLGFFCFCFLQVLRVEWRVCASWMPLLYLKGIVGLEHKLKHGSFLKWSN
jgi:hypothetical protein